MTQPQPELPPAGPAGPAASAGAARIGAVRVVDHLEPRIRLPADLLRCVIASIEIVLLAGLGLLARATATGVEYDVGHASRRLPALLLGVMGFLAHFALLVLPVALAVRLALRRQPRRLTEAVLTGLIAAAVVAGANLLLLHGAAQMYQALAPSGAGRHAAPLDGYLAGLAAYVTVIGLSGSQRWRTAFWLTIAFYALASLANDHANILSLLIALLIGSAIGSGLRYAFGSASERPSADGDRRRARRRRALRSSRSGGSGTTARRPAGTRRSRRTAAGSTSRSSTGTSRPRTCCTGCTGGSA